MSGASFADASQNRSSISRGSPDRRANVRPHPDTQATRHLYFVAAATNLATHALSSNRLCRKSRNDMCFWRERKCNISDRRKLHRKMPCPGLHTRHEDWRAGGDRVARLRWLAQVLRGATLVRTCFEDEKQAASPQLASQEPQKIQAKPYPLRTVHWGACRRPQARGHPHVQPAPWTRSDLTKGTEHVESRIQP